MGCGSEVPAFGRSTDDDDDDDVSVPINLSINLGFVPVNGPRETNFVNVLRIT